MKKVTVSNLQELPYAMEEAVNRLRVNVGFLGENIRKIMIISTFPNEGKSLMSLHLWRQMAEAGIHSVFVDVDMRKSVLLEEYPLLVEPSAETQEKLHEEGEESSASGKKKSSLMGTSNFLAGKIPLEDVLCHTQYKHGDLIFNTENVVNPSILLESRRFSDLLETLSQQYRYVFLDTPPLDLVSDGERIGNQCDGAILVVHSGVTPTAAVKASVGQLERAGCPVLGVVLNRAAAGRGGYYSKRYGGYYGHYYSNYYKGSSE